MSDPHPSPPPSVFLSYASEDRAAVRRLRDALEAEGLEVWYDENELTGGESWDRKIRRQIRECTYFMPVISAQSNARPEGYFRREWRVAVERTLDMADDLIFLLPVVIDDTVEANARVPDPFLNVQWLRVPGGEPTPALGELAQRLLAGGAHRLHKPVETKPRPKPVRATTTPPISSTPPPLSASPEKERHPPPKWLVPVIELWRWMPRWAKVLTIVIGLPVLLSKCDGNDPPPARKQARDKLAVTSTGTTAGANPSNVQELFEVGKQVDEALRRVGAAQASRRKNADVSLLAFTGGPYAATVHQDLFGRLVVTRGVSTRYSHQPLRGTPGDSTPLERGKADGARLVLSAEVARNDTGTEVLRARLDRVADGANLWTADFPTTEKSDATATLIYAQVLPLLTKKE